ncbi:MAG TPA: LptF/LptG family permease [Caulobacteraceae bacterium]|nr:LptF/LptG family permease [Caulobacteraceae bacterium]
MTGGVIQPGRIAPGFDGPPGMHRRSRRRSGARALGFRPKLLDSYLLAELAPPMAAAVTVILIALLLFRALEIFNYVAGSSARFGIVPQMIADLVPQYLGLAAPGAYFISMFLVVARMGDTSEIDAILASGLSMTRLTLPLVALGLVVAVFNIALLGFAQPLGHYGFHSHLDVALHAPWDARAQPRTFIGAGADVVLSADAVDPSGRALRGVFIRRVAADGTEEVFTAEKGALVTSPDQTRLTVVLTDGQQLQERSDGPPLVGKFSQLAVEVTLSGRTGAFRGRGPEPRELTMFELPARMRTGPEQDRLRAASEFHTRIVRTLSVPLLPLLAVPAGMAAKRRRRALGAVVCAVALFLYENSIDVGQDLVDMGRAPVALAIWLPFVLFAAVATVLFRQSVVRPGQTPFTAVSDAADALVRAVRTRLPPKVSRP